VLGREVLFETNGFEDGASHQLFDVAPDGRFLMIRIPESGASFVLIQNWFTDLLAKTEGAR
jgi:hypothetical protein